MNWYFCILLAKEVAKGLARVISPAFWLKWFKIIRLNAKVDLLYQQGKYEQAIPIATEVCDLIRQYLEENNLYLEENNFYFNLYFAGSLKKLAMLYEAIGNYAQVQQPLQQATEILSAATSKLNEIAKSCQVIGYHNIAETFYQTAMEICRTGLGEEHPDFASSLDNLADLYYTMGKYAQAEPLLQQALEIQRMALGEENPEFASSLNNLGGFYYTTGKYAQAEPLLKQALEIRRVNPGEQHPEFAASLNNLATLYEAIGNYTDAEEHYRQAMEICHKELGDKHPHFATSLDNLGELYYRMGKYAQAEPLLKQALEVRRVAIGEEHPEFAASLNHLAMLYEAIGNYTDAEEHYRQAMEICHKELGDKHPHFATSLDNLGELYYRMGKYAQAETLLQQALEVRRVNPGEQHPDFATSLNNLAQIYRTMGKYAQAETLLQQASDILCKAVGEGHPLFAASLDNLAELYCVMGKYTQAETLLQQALEIRRVNPGEQHPEFAISLLRKAQLYYLIGNYDAAEPLIRQASGILHRTSGENSQYLAASFLMGGFLYSEMGNDAVAKKFCHQAMEIYRRVLGEDPLDFYANLNLINLYCLEDNYAKAEERLQQLSKITGTVLGKNNPEFATSLLNLAGLYHLGGNYDKAESIYQQVLEIEHQLLGEKHPALADSLTLLALLYVTIERETEALKLMEQAVAIDDRMLGQVFCISSEHQRIIYVEKVRGRYELFLSLLFTYFSDNSLVVQAGLDLVLRRKGIVAETLAAQRDAVLGGRYPKLAPKLEELTSLRMQIVRQTLDGSPNPENLQPWKHKLEEMNAQKERLETELARQIPEMNLEQQLQKADRQSVALVLPKETILVEFVRFDVFNFKGEPKWQTARYLAFILPSGEPENVQMFDLGEADHIEQMIAKFRASITGKTECRGFDTVPIEFIPEVINKNGVALRKTIFDPLLAAIGDRKRLFLAPDGELTKLPFEVLPTDDGHRLIDKYYISYLSTGRDVLRLGVESSGISNVPLVAADPDFDLSTSETLTTTEIANLSNSSTQISCDLESSTLSFTPLSGTRKEGEHIAELLNIQLKLDIQLWLDKKVLESPLKKYCSPRILHIATHGFFLENQQRDPNTEFRALMTISQLAGSAIERLSGLAKLENPLLRSGLALAGANSWNKGDKLPLEAEDGILTAEDVSAMNLLDTEMVVLSACQTGLGEVFIGEGVFGLRRAFVLAGAKTLVMSLWKVPDKQTQELMEDFYKHLLDGKPRAEALRSAQLAMKEKYPNPLFWGAFICQGDPSSLSQINNNVKPVRETCST